MLQDRTSVKLLVMILAIIVCFDLVFSRVLQCFCVGVCYPPRVNLRVGLFSAVLSFLCMGALQGVDTG